MEYTEILKRLKNNIKKLTFLDESHSYYFNDEKVTAVSNKLKSFYEPFDLDISKYVALKRGISKQEVLQEWENKRIKSANNGTEIHLFAENYMKGTNEILNPNDELLEKKLSVLFFLKNISKDWKLVGTEVKVISEKYKFAGTIDLLWLNTKTGKLIIDDYKTNEFLDKWYKKYLLYPFEDIQETNYNKYTLQLNHYKLALEDLGLEVEEMRLIHIKESDYKIYNNLLDLKDRLIKYYDSIRNYTENSITIF